MIVIGEAKNGVEAIELSRKFKPDVILMDLVMPEMDGIDATRTIMNEDQSAKILIFNKFH